MLDLPQMGSHSEQRNIGVLLAAPDSAFLRGTAQALRRDSFKIITIITAPDGHQALKRWHAEQPEVVVLEVALPDRTGFDVCRQIRESGSTPVILLSPQTADEQVVEGFHVGADDYLMKPVRPRELALRIRAVARRGAEARARESQQAVRVASLSLELDLEAHQVRQGNRLTQLTPLQFRLLHQLASNAWCVVPAERFIRAAWGYDGGDTRSLKLHVSQIRQKLQLPRQGAGSL